MYDTASSLDADGELAQWAKDDLIIGDNYRKMEWGYADKDEMVGSANRMLTRTKAVDVSLSMEASDPLMYNSPDIQYDMRILIDYTDRVAPKFRLEGTRSAYPCMDVYISSQRIFEYDTGGSSPGWLLGPGRYYDIHGNVNQ